MSTSINLRWYTQKLKLAHAFGISRSTRTHVENVFVEITCDGITGIGEASPNTRYNETPESAVSYLEKVEIPDDMNPADISSWISILYDAGDGEYAAKVAVEMAVWDWIGKKIDMPLHQLWNLNTDRALNSSFTIGLDSLEVIKEKVQEADEDGATILKVKLGSDHDKEIIETIRSVSDTEIWVDANEGWKTLDQARDMVQFLGDKHVSMIEQPMPSSEFESMKLLKPLSTIPLIADESFTGKQSLEELAEGFHGINIKLMKVGSLRKAHQIIDDAKSAGLKIMIGCMIETAIANTAGALLSLRADFADLDGWKLLSDRPFDGMTFGEGNRIVLNDLPGLGVKAVKE